MPVQTLDMLRAEIVARKGSGMTWRAMSPLYGGIPAGTLCAIAKGRVPRKPSVRAALGLPVEAITLAEPRECDCGCRTVFVPRVPNQKRMPGHRRRRKP